MLLSANYHLAGSASAFFMTLSLTGLLLQVQFIWARKRRFAAGELGDERPTSTISLNRFFSGFLGFYSMLVYGLCLQPLNHYLVWPRLLAVAIIAVIFYAVMTDRKGAVPNAIFVLAVMLILATAAIRAFGAEALVYGAAVAQMMVVAATAIFVQGAVHQIIKIRRAGRTGGLSLPMHQLFFLKDFSLFLFGLTMGIAQGWPLLLLSGISTIMQSAMMWQFHWARKSPIARQRRTMSPPD